MSSFSRSNGDLSVNLMRRVVVAAVTSVAIHVRIRALVAGPEGPIARSGAAAEQPSESHHRAA